MWRSALGYMHHAFLWRNYEKLERRGYCFFFKRWTYADLNNTVAALRGLVYQLVLQERSTFFKNDTIRLGKFEYCAL
jgi:hypothetical protein